MMTSGALRQPAATAVAVAIIVLLGLYSLSKLPIQLFPDIERPQISIEASWRAASPKEVEAEIVEPIEAVLQGLPGVEEMSASASAGSADISLSFGLETDMQKTLVDVIGRMNRLDPLPRDASQPTVRLSGSGSGGSALIWYFLQVLPGNDRPVDSYHALVEDVISPALEAIPGVARARPEGAGTNREQELQILFDPYRAAQLGIQIPAISNALGRADDVSGGFIDVGRRQYTLRFAGRYTPEQLGALVLEWRDGRPITLGDVADIKVDRRERTSLARQNGNAALGIRIDRESGANDLETLNRVKVVIDELQAGPLKEHQVALQQSFDASVFIYRAIGLVTGNLLIGVLLAVGILWWFLRRLRATLIVALAIPVSLLSTFIVLKLTGRTLNVISLAGLAFAVGMVLDAAIVVLENVVRLREKGLSGFDAALKGASQVWGALVASTITTVAIFVPVVFLKNVEGQLFSDLAMTIAIAVSISLLVAMTIVPLAARKWLANASLEDTHTGLWDSITQWVMHLTSTARRRYQLVAGLILVPLVASWFLLPELDYLPPVKRDAVDTQFQMPPATNIETIDKDIVQVIEKRVAPYMSGDKQPALKNYFILVWSGGGMMGARAVDQSRVKELERVVNEEFTAGLPDLKAYSAQGNLFGGFGGSRSIPLHLQSSDSRALAELAGKAMDWIKDAMPDAQVRPQPGLQQSEPELRMIPDDRALQEQGMARADMGAIVRALGSGTYVGEYFDGSKRMDIILRAKKWQAPEELTSVPLATPAGSVVPLSRFVSLERTVGPDQIRRIDRKRTMTLSVRPPEDMSLEKAVRILRQQVEPKIKAAMPADGSLLYGGSADNLNKALVTMTENFLVALVVLFLLMSALFRSTKDSLLVVLSMPLAMVGGIVAIRVLNLVTHQPMDLLTMIGFVILLGLVVNNAILLVHQTRTAEGEGLGRHQAVEQALRLRLRPIFMSTLTSIFGMLPLLLVPGEGSVIYRGLAAVIVGGMCVSTLFTLVLLPCFLRMGKARPGQPDARDKTDTERPRLESVA
ncbi:efflux RND transporter permease subunit [Porticoccus sp. GXU_MW_L64]